MTPCSCANPSFCLDCVLSHIIKNGFDEGKSSVSCPTCRGEVCIYDIQEVTLTVPSAQSIQSAQSVKTINMMMDEVQVLKRKLEEERQYFEEEKTLWKLQNKII